MYLCVDGKDVETDGDDACIDSDEPMTVITSIAIVV